MNFRSYPIQISLRLLLLLFSMGLLFYLSSQYELIFVNIVMVLVLIGQAIELAYYQQKLLIETRKFLEAVRFGDLSTRFDLARSGKAFAELEQEFSRMLSIIHESKVKGDHRDQILNLILQNLNLGIMLVDEQGHILLTNEKCQELLDIPNFQNWKRLEERLPSLAKVIGNFDFTGRKLWSRENGSGAEEFYLDLQHLQLAGIHYHLLSIGTMRHALEEKEMEAWHRLIRILAHEVMNSVTPVVSLSETLRDMVAQDGKAKKPEDLSEEDLSDMHEALSTIIRRSKGMLSFVEEYRKLSQLPAPEKTVVPLRELFEEVVQLMHKEAESRKVKLSYQLTQNRLAVKADKKMIEQVLINLIKNAFPALEGRENAFIELSAELQNEGVVVYVRDNGEGIDPDLISQIFVPFFSTRKSGTGIGLSLSKNIMKTHQGDLKVQSVPGEGTLFKLCFGEE
ncbi:sensor histidine kinase [Croceimicrobium sp.]|uniref:sensor histidine kinase n=1 Tax=Croceimicrobium sp. TaxID=2828340 RepID=UPI003BA9EFD8